MDGTVTEVTAIPQPGNGPLSDVKVYYAMVNIDSEVTNELRPGLSTEVQFACDYRTKVTRVPLPSIRFIDRREFVAVPEPKTGFQWRELELGLVGVNYAEVVSGLTPGERIIPKPDELSPGPNLSAGPIEAAMR